MEAIRRPPARLSWIAVALAGAVCLLGATVGADARWLAAIGAAITRSGSIPDAVPYASAPSHGWHDAPALGQLVFHELEALLGDRGLILAQAAAATAALLALVIDMRSDRTRDPVRAAIVLALLVAAPAHFLVSRGELFSLALFPLLVLLLRSEARSPSPRIWLGVPLLALWANLHGGVLVGAAVLATYLLLSRLRVSPITAVAVLLASGAALLATPALLGTFEYYTGVLHGEISAQHYGLWARPSLHDPLDIAFFAVAVPLLLAALRVRRTGWETAALVLLALMTAQARRNEIWLVLFAATPAARALSGARTDVAELSRRAALVCACVPALIVALALARHTPASGAGSGLLRHAVVAAGGTPVLADAVNAEKLALGGARIWIGNPLDAFDRADQRHYLAWLQGEPAGDAALALPVRVALVTLGSEPQHRLAANTAFDETARDARAALYVRVH